MVDYVLRDLEKIISTNSKAFNNYEILEKYEAGIELRGSEMKSLRLGKISLKDSYAKIKGGEVYLIDTYIAPYSCANIFNHKPERERKLLLHKREIKRLYGKIKERGLTLIPLRIYLKNGKAKVEIALAKGKRIHDRREELKRKVMLREAERELKDRRIKT
jgi:SsrA-binding protein